MNKKIIIIAGAVLLVLAIAFLGLNAYANSTAKNTIDSMLAEYKDAADISYSAVKANWIAGSVTISDLVVKPKNQGAFSDITVKNVYITNIDTSSDFPAHLNVSLKDVALDTTNNKFLSSLTEDNKLYTNINISFDYNSDDKQLNLKVFKIELDNLCTVDISAVIDSFDPSSEDNSMDEYEFSDIRVVYTDNSLVKKIFKAIAEESDYSEEIIKMQISQFLDFVIMSSNDSAVTKIFTSVKDFIKKPGEFTLSVQPDKPVSVSDFSMYMQQFAFNPSKIVKDFNISLEIKN